MGLFCINYGSELARNEWVNGNWSDTCADGRSGQKLAWLLPFFLKNGICSLTLSLTGYEMAT